MNQEAKEETEKRLKLLTELVEEVKDKAIGVILVGSMAYAPNEAVRKDSDLDLIVVYDDIKDCVDDYFRESDYLKTESYDGYLAKRHKNSGHKIDLKSKNIYDLDVSVHNLNYSALQKISYCNYETLAYYRQSQKSATYYSQDFNGQSHPFTPECLNVLEQMGERRIDTVAFQSKEGNYVLGNDIDKLLSGAKIIYDKDGRIQHSLDYVWQNITKKFVEHKKKNNQAIDVNDVDLGPFLFRYDRFSEKTRQDIKNKSRNGVVFALGSITPYQKIDYLKNIMENRKQNET